MALSGLILASTQAAYAIEPNAVADRLKQVMKAQGLEMTFKGVSGDSANVLLQGTSVGVPGQPGTVAVGDVQLTGVAEDAGRITIDRLTVPPYSFAEGKSSVSTSELVTTKVVLPSATDTGPLAGFPLYDSMAMKSLAVSAEGKQVFAVDDLHFESKIPSTPDGSLEFSGAAEKFTADLSNSPDPQTKAIIETMGYQTLNGSMALKGSWKPSNGQLAIDQYDIAVDKAGTLGMTFDIGGYTAEFIASLREMQKKMAANPGQDQSAQGIAMLGLMQQITVSGISIRFDDDSLTGKVLDLVAKQQGAKPADIVNQVKAIVPFGLAQLNNPELAASVSAAVGKFLDNPKSIEIKAAPAQPVPVAQLVAVGSTAPMTLPQVLGVSVTANEQ